MKTSQKVIDTLIKGAHAYKLAKSLAPTKRIPIKECFPGVHLSYCILDGIDWNMSAEDCAAQIIANRTAYNAEHRVKRDTEPSPVQETAVPESGVRIYRTNDGRLWISLDDIAAMATAETATIENMTETPVPTLTVVSNGNLFE